MEIMNRILGMVVYRPYVFVFFAIYFFFAARKVGIRQTGVMTVVGYVIAFWAEFCSTRIGFPFGLYHYVEVTRDRELWVANVPFWDSLSFTFLSYVGWRLGIFLYAPLWVEKDDFQVLDTREVRGSKRVLVAGTILIGLLDVVIDPVTLLGERWFLGKLYYYPEKGLYFGVPVSNFLGWLLVVGSIIWCYQRLDRMNWMDPALHSWGIGWVRWGGIVEVLLYFGIFLFNWAVTLAIGEWQLALVDAMIVTPVLLLVATQLLNRQRWAHAQDWEAHLSDFPVSFARRGGR